MSPILPVRPSEQNADIFVLCMLIQPEFECVNDNWTGPKAGFHQIQHFFVGAIEPISS